MTGDANTEIQQAMAQLHPLSFYLDVVIPMLESQGWMDEHHKALTDDLLSRFPDKIAPYSEHIRYTEALFPMGDRRGGRIFFVGSSIRPYHFGPRASIALAKTGGEMLQILSAAMQLAFPSMLLERRGECLEIRSAVQGWTPLPQSQLFVTGFIQGTMAWMCGPDILQRLCFGFEAPEWSDSVRRVVGCPVESGCDVTRMCFNAECLERALN